MVFFYKYGDKALENTNSCKHFMVLTGAEKTFKLELFVNEYDELLIFL